VSDDFRVANHDSPLNENTIMKIESIVAAPGPIGANHDDIAVAYCDSG